MFRNILWNDYIIVVVFLMVSWYVFVGLRYYLDEIKDVVGGKKKLQGWEKNEELKVEPEADLRLQDSLGRISSEMYPQESNTIFHEVEALIKQLKSVLNEVAQKEPSKQELEEKLRLILIEYPLLSDSPYRSAVDELIVSECEKYGLPVLIQQEVAALWNKRN